MTFIVVQTPYGLEWRKLDSTYLVHDIAIIKRVNRQIGTPVVAVVKEKE